MRVVHAAALATASALSTSKLPPVVRLFGLSDLHVDYAANLDTVKHLQRPPGEGHLALIIAGDVTADRGTLREALAALRETFDDVFYVQDSIGYGCSTSTQLQLVFDGERMACH